MRTATRPITRSPQATFGLALVAAVCGAVTASVLLFVENPIAFLMSLVTALLALVFGAAALHGAWRTRARRAGTAGRCRRGTASGCTALAAARRSRAGPGA